MSIDETFQAALEHTRRQRNTVAFDHGLLDKVRIKALDCTSIVDGIQVDTRGTFYRVIYWDNADRKSEWLYGFEIEAMGGKES